MNFTKRCREEFDKEIGGGYFIYLTIDWWSQSWGQGLKFASVKCNTRVRVPQLKHGGRWEKGRLNDNFVYYLKLTKKSQKLKHI